MRTSLPLRGSARTVTVTRRGAGEAVEVAPLATHCSADIPATSIKQNRVTLFHRQGGVPLFYRPEAERRQL